MDLIRAARDETDFYGFKALRYKKLKGRNRHLRQMRLNDQSRLRLTIEKAPDGNVVVVLAIGDFHDEP